MTAVEEVFKALGDPARVKIVEMLAENGEMCVCRIFERLSMTQPAVSHHLAILKRAGLVRARKQGQWVHYSLDRNTLSLTAEAFLGGLLEKLEAGPEREHECEREASLAYASRSGIGEQPSARLE